MKKKKLKCIFFGFVFLTFFQCLRGDSVQCIITGDDTQNNFQQTLL